MFKKIPELQTDPKLEKEGVKTDVQVIQADGTVINAWVKVRRAGGNNYLFAQVAKTLRKPFKYQLEHDMMSPEQLADLNRNILSDGCLADFGGFPGEDGQEVPYSLANARALMLEYSVVRDIVATTADDAARYRLAEHNLAVEQAKNA